MSKWIQVSATFVTWESVSSSMGRLVQTKVMPSPFTQRAKRAAIAWVLAMLLPFEKTVKGSMIEAGGSLAFNQGLDPVKVLFRRSGSHVSRMDL